MSVTWYESQWATLKGVSWLSLSKAGTGRTCVYGRQFVCPSTFHTWDAPGENSRPAVTASSGQPMDRESMQSVGQGVTTAGDKKKKIEEEEERLFFFFFAYI